MATPENSTPRDEQGPADHSHPEPACQEAQKWIEAVTGKSFGDKDFRSALENGILLCELLSAIKPGLVKKINRLPTPIAGLDNLSVFLRGCEELGLKGSQLFDPGDLQDTSIRANLKDSDCNRKLKNVLNTVFWLGKAASGCASYSGPTLNVKEFEGLLAQMKVESEDTGESPQKRSVRDSGYDCWDSERSESLSPPRHTRDNSLDSLDSFGSRSQHSPSPDVVNRGNSDGRGSDSEADAPGKRPDVRKDDMLARRTAGSETRSSVPFNQFLPNRANACVYIPTHRRKQHTEEGEQRRMSRRVAFMSEDAESASLSDILNEDEVGHLPHISQSRYERMQEQYNSFREEENEWQDDLVKWKNRRRSASQELIKKEEERKRMEKKLKEESDRRKSIKTYKEIVEEKERREAELCEAYRNAATPEEAAMVLQRYALRFTISDATLDSLKVPRPIVNSSPDQVDKENQRTSPVSDSEMSEHLQKTVALTDHKSKLVEVEVKTTDKQEETSSSTPTSPVKTAAPKPPQSQKPAETLTTHQQLRTQDAQAHPKPAPAPSQLQLHTAPVNTLPSPPPVSRPVPLLAAKPYCSQAGHKSVKMDGLVRVNGEATEDAPVCAPPVSPLRLPEEKKSASPKRLEKDVPSEQTLQKRLEHVPPPQTEKPASAISSLIGGRNCIITTTIVTELTHTHVEPLPPQSQSNGQVNGTSGSSGEAVEEKSPAAPLPNSMQDYSPTVTEGLEESDLTVQYQKEQEKLKKEWERAQLEVQEEERKHNEEERRILEETVAPLNTTGLLNQQPQTNIMLPTEANKIQGTSDSALQHNGIPVGKEDQHASKLHFIQDSACEVEASSKQELLKTASLDHVPQPNQAQSVKRSGSHDAVSGSQQSHPSPQPPSPSRCVSGKRLCSGCSQPLGKGAAMIIDTLGLFFHMNCFKCGVCDGQLGDASAGTDVRIRNGLLSCHECYIASRGRGQPTTL